MRRLLRIFGGRHALTVETVTQPAQTAMLYVGEKAAIHDAAGLFATVEIVGDRKIRIIFQRDDERITVADLEFLAASRPGV